MAFGGTVVCPECGGVVFEGDRSKGKKVGAVLCSSCTERETARQIARPDVDPAEGEVTVTTRREATLGGVLENGDDAFARISFLEGDDRAVRLEVVPFGGQAIRIALWRSGLVKALKELGVLP